MAQANVTNTLVVPAQSKVAPYFDDFTESKNFHRILFRPGYAVQARELTQLQTILQNQIERFGRHIFVNGSSVIGGKLDIADIITLNVQPEYANTVVNISDFKDKTIRLSSGSSNVLARVIQTSSATATTPPALHIKYLTGTEFVPGSVISTTDNVATASLVATSNSSANGVIAFLYDSIYFMQGYFVKVPSQATILSKYDRVPTAKIGLELKEEFITETADTSLLDPALESSNYQAPGASRYKLTLELASRDITSEDDEKFIQIARVENGVIKEKVTNPTYSEIEEVLARRTYDESGNYIVKPFILKLEESVIDPANNFTAIISPGKAYLYGYETETQSDLAFEIPKARDFLTQTGYDLNMNYGNYVLVDNLKGNFNTGMGLVDMHCVKADQVNVSSTFAYNSTKVGTARLRDLEFYSGGANTAQRTFEFYFVDNKFKTLSANAGDLTVANNQIHLGNTANISTVDDAYTGSFINIVSGASNGDVREIISYNGASRVANVSIDFTAPTNNTSNYEITFDITDVDSFYQSRVFTGGATSNASATISLLSKDDGTYNGNTIITEPGFLNGLFAYPKKYIKSIENQSYIYRRTYNTIQFTSGESSVITASTGEEFEGASSTSNTSSTVMDNWLVIVTDKLTSSRNVGDQVLVTTSITNSTPEQAVLSTGNTSDTFIATVYAKVNASDVAATQRVKTLVLANTQYFTTETSIGPFENPTGSTTWVFPNSGQVIIYNPSDTEAESLYISDVIGAVKIYATSITPNANVSFATTLDVTDRYIVDNGQKNTHYDHATIKLKPGYANPKGFIIACLRYYKSSNDVGYFSVDSYPSLNNIVMEEGKNIGTGYSLIPRVNGTKMSDVIDFRPVRPNASNTEFYNFTSVRTPVATSDFRSDYSYYLERWDTLCLNLDNKIQRIKGISSENPTFSAQPDRSLLLHRLRIKPYTERLLDVLVTSINHRRYTMKDISNIDQRLRNVEYSVSLNSLEKKAEDIVIRDADGLDRTKYGILAENFKSHLLADIYSPDYSCSIDLNKVFTPREGLLMPKVFSNEVNLSVKKEIGKNISVHDDKILLSYTTAPAISQTTATKTTPVAEFLFADFRGNIVCSPEGDTWKDTTVLPETVISIPPPIIKYIPSEPQIIIKEVPVPGPVQYIAVNTPTYNPQIQGPYPDTGGDGGGGGGGPIIVRPPKVPDTKIPEPPQATCIVGDALVTMSDGSEKRIDEIVVGEYVATPEGRPARVIDIHKPIVGTRGLLSINGSKPFATTDHAIKSKDNIWLVADLELANINLPSFKYIQEKGGIIKQIEIGDFVATTNGLLEVATFEIIGQDIFDETSVYDIMLDNDSNHEYFADGVVVHNCTPPPPPPPTPTPVTAIIDKVLLLTDSQYYDGLGYYRYDYASGTLKGDATSYVSTTPGLYDTAGFSETAYLNFMTTAVNQSGYIDFKVDLNTDRGKEVSNWVYDNYLNFVDRPPETMGAAWWTSQAIEHGWDERETAIQIAIGAGQSGELSIYAGQDNRSSLTPTVVVDDGRAGYSEADTVSVTSDTFAGQYTANDAGGTSRDLSPKEYIENLYDAFFDREPDEKGFNDWYGFYKDSGFSQEAAATIAEGFRSSAENIALEQSLGKK